MMDQFLKQAVDAHMPRENPYIMNGIGYYAMLNSMEYIHMAFSETAKSFPSCLKYLGIEKASVRECLDDVRKTSKYRQRYELAKSTFYLLKVEFEFTGNLGVEKITKYIKMPYTLPNLPMVVSGGVRYNILPVISDKVISFEQNSIFVKLFRDKNNYKRLLHPYKENGVVTSSSFVYVNIYRASSYVNNKIVRPSKTRVNTTVLHYLFGKYGAEETFKKFLGINFVYLHNAEEVQCLIDAGYTCCQSARTKPILIGNRVSPPPTGCLLIPPGQMTQDVRSVVSAFFYMLDNIPDWSLFTPAVSRLYLGKINIPDEEIVNKIRDKIDEHFNSLDVYLDAMSMRKLRANDIHVADYYELMWLVNKNFNQWLRTGSKMVGINMYNKIYEVLQYVLYPITECIVRAAQELNKKNARSPLTAVSTTDVLNRVLRKGAIFDLSKQKIYAQIVSYSGDHKFPAISSMVALQQDADGDKVVKNKKRKPSSRDKLNFSMIEAGNIFWIRKSNYNPIYALNPYANLNPLTLSIEPNPKYIELGLKIDNVLANAVEPSGQDVELVDELDIDPSLMASDGVDDYGEGEEPDDAGSPDGE